MDFDKQRMEEIESIIENHFYKIKLDFERYILKGNQRYKVIFERMYTFYFITQYISSKISYNFKGNERELMGLYNKIVFDFWGIYNCLANGALMQAAIIKRSMLESEVTLQFILKENTTERLKLYTNFKYVKMWRQLKNHQKLDKLSQDKFLKGFLPFSEIRKIKINYDLYKNDYNLRFPNWFYKEFKDTNHTPNIKTLFESLGEKYKREYVSSYGTYSSLIHGNSNITDFYSEEIGKDTFVIKNEPIFNESTVSLGIGSIDICGRGIIPILNYVKENRLENFDDYIKLFIETTYIMF